MTIQKINDDVSVGCEVFSNSKAWGHIAKLFYKEQEMLENKVRYYNRTWERYQFESVLSGLVNLADKNKTIPLSDRIALAKFINRIKFYE